MPRRNSYRVYAIDLYVGDSRTASLDVTAAHDGAAEDMARDLIHDSEYTAAQVLRREDNGQDYQPVHRLEVG